MTTVTITSQGQITLPVEARRALRLKGADKLHVSYNPETGQIHLQKPMTITEFTKLANKIAKKIPKGIQPIRDDKIHEFYESDRAKQIVERMREGK